MNVNAPYCRLPCAPLLCLKKKPLRPVSEAEDATMSRRSMNSTGTSERRGFVDLLPCTERVCATHECPFSRRKSRSIVGESSQEIEVRMMQEKGGGGGGNRTAHQNHRGLNQTNPHPGYWAVHPGGNSKFLAALDGVMINKSNSSETIVATRQLDVAPGR